MQNYFEFSPEVENAIKQKKGILALESTLITHGLPYPDNINTALELEEIARQEDAVPATTALLNGKIKIGLSKNELERLVSDENKIKITTRDIPYALANKLSAGTTVAATLFCAAYAGIKVFSTGGIGGVHRGDANDISADLIELSKTSMAVVCSGAKAILDIPKTLEYLETFGVPIIGYRTNTLPAFYSASSDYPLAFSVMDIDALLPILQTHWKLGMQSSVIIANPVNKDDEVPAHIINPIIEKALQAAEKQQIRGKAITPFLLKEISCLTKGISLKANISLIKGNVRLGAKLAKQLSVGS